MRTSVTFSDAGPLQVRGFYEEDGRAQVWMLDGPDGTGAATFWITPETAAQWIETLTPLAEKAAGNGH